MKKFIETKIASIYPFLTPNEWIFLSMPVSVVEIFTFYLDPENADGGSFEESSLCLN